MPKNEQVGISRKAIHEASEEDVDGIKMPERPIVNVTPVEHTVTVYFSDGEAMYLIPEERRLTASGRSSAEMVIGELIRGPQEPDHVQTVPPNARLRSLWVDDGIAYVDFSREFQTEHWGGSAGDTFTLFSVVNSLTELPGIEAVQFLVEGEMEEAILGHTDTTEPMGRREDLIRRR